MQPKLLRVLAEQRIKSVGSNQYVGVDVRVIAATRRDLLEEINRGAFRDDLFFRIAHQRFTVPPLRERADDIPRLLRHMMQAKGKGAAFKRVSPEAIDRLMRHDWPGNVRELRNLVSVALAYDRGSGSLRVAEHIAEQAPRGRKAQSAAPLAGRPYADSKQEHDRAFFTALYRATDGNLMAMSRRAGINRETVRTHLRALGIGGYPKD